MESLQAKTNFNRICQLLIDKGSDALRRALHVVYPSSTLAAALHSHKKTLQKLRYNVINPSQWRLLYPAAGPPNSNNFDITLLTILLRNICGLSSPATGWNAMPPTTDSSISADILRIKMFRNEVYGHTASAQYDDAAFEKFWQRIAQPLVKLGIPQQEIDELKVTPLSPEEESYIEKLKEWKELEDTLLEKMKDIESQMVDMRAEVRKLTGTLDSFSISNIDKLAKFDFKGKIYGSCKKFHEGTRQWLFDHLSTWFADEESRVMILTAGPGIGKSVLSAKVCQDYSESKKLAACHFCDFKTSDCGNPSRILESLASQMCDNVDGFRHKLTETLRRNHSRDSLGNAFRVLLDEPLHALQRREPMLIVVDGLDESKTDDKSELLELISDKFSDLPQWIKILITSRPELQVKKKLEHFHPFQIFPQDVNQEKDLKCFVEHHLPILDEDSKNWLVSLCEGSFLYAYYMVKELNEIDVGVELNLSDYAPKGISGFYQKQFQRLRTGLRNLDPGIFNIFLNVVAASRAPLPISILLKCMNISNEDYETRDTIINIMSEILPLHDNCLTVYHKSLTDWLTLNGYEEHAFEANVDDGIKRLWKVCEGIYRVIDSMKSVSDLQLVLEMKFALENGGKYLLNVGDVADFYWFVNIRLNALKFRFCGNLDVDYYRILNNYKSTLSGDLYWSMFQHYYIIGVMQTRLRYPNYSSFQRYVRNCNLDCKRVSYVEYLQFIANAHFDFSKKNLSSQNTARDILAEENEMWLKNIVNVQNSDYELISSAILSDDFDNSKCSPDKKLVALSKKDMVKVFQLPDLKMIFELQVSGYCSSILFSPDSSYFLCHSTRSCVCIRKRKEVAFLPSGNRYLSGCSFSSCGKKLVAAEGEFLKVWDVEKRELLVQIMTGSSYGRYYFSSCNKYILQHDSLVVRDSTTLKEFQRISEICSQKCPDSNQIMFLVDDLIDTSHFHLSTKVVVITPAKSFTWKNRRCQVLSFLSTLSIYDMMNKEVIDRFQIDCLPACTVIHCISKLDGANFLLSLDNRHIVILSLETSEEASIVSYVFRYHVRCVALSPDNIYVACCYHKNNVLTIKNVENGQILKTVELRKPPKALWWSELYLWVVHKRALVRFPYYSKHTNVLGNGVEICRLKFDKILGFGEGVFVCKRSDNIVTILKISDNMPFLWRICDLPFNKAAISKDGCAVLFYIEHWCDLLLQLWEFTREGHWKLYFDGEIRGMFTSCFNVVWVSLSGTRNCRRSMFVQNQSGSGGSWFILSSFNFKSRNQHELGFQSKTLDLPDGNVDWVDDVAPNLLLIKVDSWLQVFNVSDNKVIATVSFCKYDLLHFSEILYLSPQGLLLLVLDNDIKYFKIRNLENCLKS